MEGKSCNSRIPIAKMSARGAALSAQELRYFIAHTVQDVDRPLRCTSQTGATLVTSLAVQ